MLQVQKRMGGGVFSLLVVVFVVGNGIVAPPVQAGCTNYEDYLHWVSSLHFESAPSQLVVDGNYQYIAEKELGLNIFDVSNESDPTPVVTLELPTNVYSISISGTIAALTGPHELYLIDISEPTSPFLISQIDPDPTGTSNNVVTKGNFAYITMATSNLLSVVDFSDPETPVIATTVNVNGPGTGELTVDGDYLYVTTYDALQVVDISYPSEANIVGSWGVPGVYWVSDVAISGDIAFVISRRYGINAHINAINISDPTNPHTVQGQPVSISGYLKIAVAADVIYLGFTSNNFPMYSYSGNLFHYEGSLPPMGGWVEDLVVWGSNLHILTSYGAVNDVHTISVQSPSPMEPIGSLATSGDAQKVVIPPTRDNLAYVAVGSGGMEIINIDDPENPYIVGSIDTPGNAVDLSIVGDRAYVADSAAGVHIIDISISSSPVILFSVDTPGNALNIAVADSIVYLADGEAGLQLINISETNTPAIISNLNTDGIAQGVDISGTLCYLADGIEGLLICDVSDPDSPDIIGGVKSRDLTGAMKVDARGGFAYVTDESSGLIVLDVSDPENPVVAGASETENSAQDLNLLGIFAFVADSSSGVKVINVEDPANPSIVGNMDIPTSARSVFANENYAYVAAGSGGLQICPTQCGYDQIAIASFVSDIEEAFYPITVHFTDTSVGYGLDYAWDFGDGIGTSNEADPIYTFDSPGAYTVTLTITNGVNQDVTSRIVSALTEPPTITTITDVPNDQGGFVYVKFFRCAYDSDGPDKSEMYSVQRLDGQDWVTVNTTVAFGESYYTVLVNTQGDGSENWTTQYRVVGSMNEGIWISTPIEGFSEDNIAPAIPQNVLWVGANRLSWEQVPDTDFAYYQIYSSPSNTFEQAVPVGVTIGTEYTVDNGNNPWFFIAAVDDAGLESFPSAALGAISGIPGLPAEFLLSPAVPNPFNPSTNINFSLPKTGYTKLAVYDIAGHLVKTLVHENRAGGNHNVIWQGRNDAGRQVSSGTYFYRLEADGKALTRRMILVK